MSINNRKIIEQKEWEYYIFQKEDTIEIAIPIGSPAPGFDVIHVLNPTEEQAYNDAGIKALENRINDMKANFSNYKTISWR